MNEKLIDFAPFKHKIWLAAPTMHGEEEMYITEAIASNWVSTEGANLAELERLVGEKVGINCAVPLSSGTAALHLAVKLAGIGEGDIVFCSDMTFDATVNAIVYEKGVPVFVDAEYGTWNMDPAALEQACRLYPNAKAVMVVNLYGTPARYDEILDIAERYGLAVLEDAAESFGATYKGRQTGTFGRFNAISFNGNKIITGSSGGTPRKTMKWPEVVKWPLLTKATTSFPPLKASEIFCPPSLPQPSTVRVHALAAAGIRP